MKIDRDTKACILDCIKVAAEQEAYGGSDLVDILTVADKALDMAMQRQAGHKMTLQSGEFTERAIELYFNADDNLILRILPKNKDQWEYCAFNKGEAGDFIEVFNDMLSCFGEK